MALPAPEQVRSVMQRYVQLVDGGDIDGILRLYAEDATVEDPVGQPPLRGIEQIAAFYRQGLGRAKVSATLTGPVCVTHAGCGAMPLRVDMQWQGRDCSLQVIDVMTFDEQGLIVGMKAYWSEVNVAPR
ncbi:MULTISPECIES: steroid Delta-isomerase [unclassified Pseudomonas]|uniref:steroid Delta-isomerase n=1 Tax=unclassified Pseudomonas TaxID=196821 RepID=UPI0024498A1A|nr:MULTISPECIES: steroid Delta-isomerase [unclassified Pseudomonas]MDH0301676.1 nuclear transport factor 2 family protein [Pseudomonas sp. GD04091]MDH1984895.1 nuclear transport factor 2 family protein [Pseudomonas sp. GD03689]